jgi:hypothetical protein
MKLLKSFFSFSIFLLSITCQAQSNKSLDCQILHNVKLKYADASNRTDYVIIKNNKHVEYLENGKYFIKSDLDWINECEYNATMTEITLPNFPYKVGEVMNVKFQKIENGKVYGIATVRGQKSVVNFELIN